MSLRYFNPVGAHALGADRGGPAGGAEQPLSLHRPDGGGGAGAGGGATATTIRRRTGRRSATISTWSTWRAGIWRRIDFLLAGEGAGRNTAVNLGRGQGHSVLEAVAAFGRAAGRDIPYAIVRRRAGDVAESVADARLAAELLGWRAELDLDRMCADQWAFQSRAAAALRRSTFQRFTADPSMHTLCTTYAQRIC